MKDYQTKPIDRKRTPERVPQGFFEAFDRLHGEPKLSLLTPQELEVKRHSEFDRQKVSEMPLSEMAAASHGSNRDRAS